MTSSTRNLFFAAVLAMCGLCSEVWGASPTTAPITVSDARERELQLDRPARRIISLAPHVTEILFAVGAGAQVVGTVSHSDHPPEAMDIPRIGRAGQLDLEAVLALRPDLIIAWDSGNPVQQLQRLEGLGLAVYYSNPGSFEALASEMEDMARLAGHDEPGRAVAASLLQTLETLRARYARDEPVDVFYQIWDQPLTTLNGGHMVSKAIALCGGQNIFGHLNTPAPRVDIEAVLAADPEVIISGGPGDEPTPWLDAWRRWPGMTAVKRDNLFHVPPSLIHRPSPRITEGTRLICEALALARQRRGEAWSNPGDMPGDAQGQGR